jgi:putative transcriptional regulator
METSILYKREYGVVRLRLQEFMDQRGINRNQMARRIGVRFEVIDKWYQGKVEKLDLDVLARLCFVLDCQAGELLEYRTPDGEE